MIIDEMVLHRPVGDPGVRNGQPHHLRNMAARPKIDPRVMPFDLTQGTTIMNPVWRKSSRSPSDGNCAEIARLAHPTVAVRDSKNPTGPA